MLLKHLQGYWHQWLWLCWMTGCLYRSILEMTIVLFLFVLNSFHVPQEKDKKELSIKQKYVYLCFWLLWIDKWNKLEFINCFHFYGMLYAINIHTLVDKLTYWVISIQYSILFNNSICVLVGGWWQNVSWISPIFF